MSVNYSLVAARSRNHIIGRDADIPWQVKGIGYQHAQRFETALDVMSQGGRDLDLVLNEQERNGTFGKRGTTVAYKCVERRVEQT